MAERGFTAILRHGDYHQRESTPSARQPFALTAKGIAQARAGGDALAQMLKDHGLQPAPVIHCSRQLRAWQTASEVSAQLRAHGFAIEELAETSALAERGLGSAANLTTAEIAAVLREDPRYPDPPTDWKSNSDYRLPLEGAESLMDAGARVAQHIAETAAPGVVTIHVGHGASFRHGFHHLGVLKRAEIAGLSMFHAKPLLFCHDGRVNWRLIAGEWKVRGAQEDAAD